MKIYNLTDHEKFTSCIINIYNGHIYPGQFINLEPELVTDKVLALGDKIAIDVLPDYYTKWKEGKLAPPIPTVQEETEGKKNGRKQESRTV